MSGGTKADRNIATSGNRIAKCAQVGFARIGAATGPSDPVAAGICSQCARQGCWELLISGLGLLSYDRSRASDAPGSAFGNYRHTASSCMLPDFPGREFVKVS